MSIDELSSWYEYYSKEPFLADRLEVQFARLNQSILAVNGNECELDDFMICNLNTSTKNNKTKKLEDKLVSIFGE